MLDSDPDSMNPDLWGTKIILSKGLFFSVLHGIYKNLACRVAVSAGLL
jgi:hypothetical protein